MSTSESERPQHAGSGFTRQMLYGGLGGAALIALAPLIIKGVPIAIIFGLAAVASSSFVTRGYWSDQLGKLTARLTAVAATLEAVQREKSGVEGQLGTLQSENGRLLGEVGAIPGQITAAKAEGKAEGIKEGKAEGIKEMEEKLQPIIERQASEILNLKATVELLLQGQLVTDPRLAALFMDAKTRKLIETDPRTLRRGETLFCAMLDMRTKRQFYRDFPYGPDVEFDGVVFRAQRGATVVSGAVQDPESRSYSFEGTQGLPLDMVHKIGHLEVYFTDDPLRAIQQEGRFRDAAMREISNKKVSPAASQKLVLEEDKTQVSQPPRFDMPAQKKRNEPDSTTPH